MPPLRSRPEDIELLVHHFLESYNRQLGKQNHGISPEAMALLKTYSWPGNVRELEHTIEAALNLTDGSQELQVADIPAYFFSLSGAAESVASSAAGTDASGAPNIPLREAVADYERGLIDHDLTQQQVAEYLGTSQTMVARYEREASELPLRHFIRLCQLYQVSADEVLGLRRRK